MPSAMDEEASRSYRSFLHGVAQRAQSAFGLDRLVWDRGSTEGLDIPRDWETQEALHGSLVDRITSLRGDQATHWRRTLPSMAILLRLARGEALDHAELVERMYLCPADPPTALEVIHLKEAIAMELPGGDSGDDLRAAVRAWEEGHRVPPAAVLPTARGLLAHLRRLTASYLPLPQDRVRIKGAKGVPWTGYSDYEGGGLSTVYINTGVPWPHPHLRSLMTHEVYPGHHAHALVMEAQAEANHAPPETSTWFLGSPFTPASEGLAEHAMALLGFPRPGDRLVFHLTLLRWAASMETVARHRAGAGEGELMELLMDDGLMDEARARQALAFAVHPLLGPSIFCYWYGTWAVRDGYSRALAEGRGQDFLNFIYSAPRTLAELMEKTP